MPDSLEIRYCVCPLVRIASRILSNSLLTHFSMPHHCPMGNYSVRIPGFVIASPGCICCIFCMCFYPLRARKNESNAYDGERTPSDRLE